MKTLFNFLILVVSFCFANLSAQSNAVYSIRNNETNSLLYMETIIAGENNSVYAIGKDNTNYWSFLIKLDDNGQLVWKKKIQTGFNPGIVSYNQITFYNNELYFLGTAYGGSPQLEYLLVKTDMSGDLIWSKNLDPICQTAYWGGAPSMSIKANSGITISSSTYGSIDIFSLNTDGTINWIRNFNSGTPKNPSFDITVTDEGDIMGCSKTQSDMSFYCMRSNGSFKWVKRVLEWGNYTHVKSIIEINNNKFLICGFRQDPLANQYGFYGFIDSTGSFLDFRLVNEVTEIKTGIIINNGNILLDAYDISSHRVHLIIDDIGSLVAGYSSPTPTPGLDIYSNDYNGLTETSNYKYCLDGQTIRKVYDFNSSECLNLVSQPITFTGDDPGSAPNANYYAMYTPGTISDYLEMQLMISDLKLEIACIGTGIEANNITDIEEDNITDIEENNITGIEENNTVSIHISTTVINNGEPIYVNSSLENTQLDYQIMDINGRIVVQQTLMENSIPINGLNSGMYIIQFAKNGNVVHVEKFVVVD